MEAYSVDIQINDKPHKASVRKTSKVTWKASVTVDREYVEGQGAHF